LATVKTQSLSLCKLFSFHEYNDQHDHTESCSKSLIHNEINSPS